MIPKIIHYCWFGKKPLPNDALKCISSWRKYCPDYEIIEWNEDNFDVSMCNYAKEAYEERKWAFVSDYARFYILYTYGGIYLDTDVELIKSIDDIVANGNFMGIESNNPIYVAPGLGLGAEKGNRFYNEILEFYKVRHFRKSDGSLDLTTVVVYVTDCLKKYGLKDSVGIQKVEGINIYPIDYFCPKDVITGELKVTNNTYAIHHFNASWISKKQKLKNHIKRLLLRVIGKETYAYIRAKFMR